MRTTMLIVFVALLASSGGAAGKGPYFPETGSGAIHQRALDLGTNATALLIALEPGYEDLTLLAYLRMGLGARCVVGYATYGSGTPGDADGGTPVQIAGERREEAYGAASHLGATAHFLNLQDPGILPSRAAIEQVWGRDTALARIDRMIRYFRPDVVILGGDFRTDTVRSLRVEALREILLDAVALAGDAKGRPDSLRPGAWRVPRVYVESERSPRRTIAQYDQPHPVWKRSYRAIAAEAAGNYRTLRLHREAWVRLGDRTYTAIVPAAGRPGGFLENLPVVTPKLRPLAASVAKLSSRGKPKARSPRLAETVSAIDTVDRYLSKRRSELGPEELRLLVGWKSALEELRCSLLEVRAEYAMSESLITSRQLVYLKFGEVSAKTPLTRTRIMFPGAVDHSWGINESIDYAFPFSPPEEFRVITPQNLDLTVPSSQTGIFQSALRTRFSFLLMHLDSIHQHEFYYRGEIPLRAGPRRTFEILTPIVRSGDGAGVVFRLINLSRDPYEGTISIPDSLVYPAVRKIRLAGKDAVLTDTLRFSLRNALPPGDVPLTLELSGGNALRFAARSFDAEVESGSSASVLSPVDDSPLMQGLTRLRMPWRRLDPAAAVLPDHGVIVMDRDAAVLPSVRAAIPRILEWVRAGGHLVVFPQTLAPSGEHLLPEAGFRLSGQLYPGAAVNADTAQRVFTVPNRITAPDWDGWVVSRSLCSIVLPADRQAIVLARSDEGNHPLLADVPYGSGRVRLVALDLLSQLSNVHPGAHRMLANILAR